MEEIQAKVKDATGDRLSIDQNMLLVEMPTTRTNQHDGSALVKTVLFPFRTRKGYRTTHGVAHIDLTLYRRIPGRRVRILKISHVDLRTRVQCVNDHLTINRTRTLNTAIQ